MLASPEVKLPPFLVGCKKHIADDLKLQVGMLAEPVEENPALIFIHIGSSMCVDLPQCRQSAGIAAQDFFLDRRRKDSGQMQLYFCSISRPTVMIVRYIIEQLFRREAICSANFSAIADGSITDDSFLAILYELDSRDKWMEPNAWMKAKPSLGAINWRKISQLRM